MKTMLKENEKRIVKWMSIWEYMKEEKLIEEKVRFRQERNDIKIYKHV